MLPKEEVTRAKGKPVTTKMLGSVESPNLPFWS